MLTPPDVVRTQACLACAANTSQKLTPTTEGCSWVCASCARSRPAFTHSQMREIVARGVFNLPTKPVPVDVPESLRVYLETHLPDVDVAEKEVSRQAVLDHVSVTGALPVAGKPLFTKHAFGAVPYGKVARVDVGSAPSASERAKIEP